VPMDEALASNPPDGAAVDYYLKQKTSGPVQLEILDAEGKLVRRFASNDELHKTDPKDVEFPMQWVRDPQPLSAEAGMHRFIWDLRYPLPQSVHTTYWGPTGPWAAPGSYIVRLTANGRSSTQPLTIKMDPRVKATQAELMRQFELASRLAARLGEVSSAMQQAGELRNRLRRARKSPVGTQSCSKRLRRWKRRSKCRPRRKAMLILGYLDLLCRGIESASAKSCSGSHRNADDRGECGRCANGGCGNCKREVGASAQAALARWTAMQKEELVSVNASLKR